MVHLDDDRKERVGEEEDLGTFREEDDDRGRLLLLGPDAGAVWVGQRNGRLARWAYSPARFGPARNENSTCIDILALIPNK